MQLTSKDILKALQRTGELLECDSNVEILLIGGAAGAITGQLPANRVTQDCDIMHYLPEDCKQAVLDAARLVAQERSLPENWLNSQAMQLDILPHGWRNRRVMIGKYSSLSVYAIGRIDLLCMKFFANRPQDREDIIAMQPSLAELDTVRKYLDMLRVPSRMADQDQVASAFMLVKAMEEMLDES